MIGIDEVGRGCWAGPLLVVAARGRGVLPQGLDDSKKLTRRRRQLLVPLIKATCDLGEGWVTPAEIDGLGLTNAMKLGVSRALDVINASEEELITMDGLINYCSDKFTQVQAVKQADAIYPIVSAASVYAKEMRDTFMSTLEDKYVKFAFDKHVGYGTKLHIARLQLHGVSDIHRRSFAPIKALL